MPLIKKYPSTDTYQKEVLDETDSPFADDESVAFLPRLGGTLQLALRGLCAFSVRVAVARISRSDSRSDLASSPTSGRKPIPSSRSAIWPRQASRGALDEEGPTSKARAASPLPIPRSTTSTIFLRKFSE